MSSGARASRRRQRARRNPRRFRAGLWGVRLLALAAAFLLGVGVGRTMEEADIDERARTSVRTLKPLPLPPTRDNITVTTAASR